MQIYIFGKKNKKNLIFMIMQIKNSNIYQFLYLMILDYVN